MLSLIQKLGSLFVVIFVLVMCFDFLYEYRECKDKGGIQLQSWFTGFDCYDQLGLKIIK